MLGKLLKYDFKAGKIILPFYLVSAVLAAVLLGGIVFGLFPTSNYILSTVSGILAFFLVISCMAVMVSSVVGVTLHFGKQTIGVQGPLMFSLPVSIDKILLSKLISGTVILFGAIVYFFGIMFLFAYAAYDGSVPGFHIGGDIWLSIGLIAAIIAMMVLSIVFSLLLVYISVGVSGYISQNRVLGSVAAYLILSFIIQIILVLAVAAIMALVMLSGNYKAHLSSLEVHYMFNYLPIIVLGVTTALIAIADTIMFFICRHIYTKKLNLP